MNSITELFHEVHPNQRVFRPLSDMVLARGEKLQFDGLWYRVMDENHGAYLIELCDPPDVAADGGLKEGG